MQADCAAQPARETQETQREKASWQPAALALLIFFVFRTGLGALRLPADTPQWVPLLAAVVTALGAIGLPIVAIALLARLRLAPGRSLLLALGGLFLWLALLGAMPLLPPALYIPVGALQDLGKIVAAGGVGIALGGFLREPNILLPAGVFAAFADFVVVNFGTVKHALSSEEGHRVVEAVSAAVPAVHPSLPPLMIGPADFLFLGIFLMCAVRFDFGLRRNAWVLTAVLALSLLAVPWVGAVPALAPMSIAFVALNWRNFRLSRQEIVSTALVLVVMGALFLSYFLLFFRAGSAG
jgi:hypothetical protein